MELVPENKFAKSQRLEAAASVAASALGAKSPARRGIMAFRGYCLMLVEGLELSEGLGCGERFPFRNPRSRRSGCLALVCVAFFAGFLAL